LKEPEFFDVPFRPRCITKISKRYILCGCQNGSLIIFDLVSGQYFTLTLKHRGYVVKVALDSKGDIWTAGGDGMVQFMELRTLEHCI
jgi:WD40 repeat protein